MFWGQTSLLSWSEVNRENREGSCDAHEALFRIRQQRDAFALLLPLEHVGERALSQITDAVAAILLGRGAQPGSASSPELTAYAVDPASQMTRTRVGGA